jgi:hypothetical protein
MAIISKYLVYYTKQIPQSLLEFVHNDRNTLLVKDGLSEIKGMKCPRLNLQVNSVNGRIDNQRIITINNLLKTLIEDGSAEHFVKI